MTNRLTENRPIVVSRRLASPIAKGCAYLLVVAIWGWGALAWAQGADPGAGAGTPQALILIAAPDLPDSNFDRSVVPVTQTPVGEMIGVILNRPTRAPWPRGLRPPAQTAGQHIHFGGPLIPSATFSIGAVNSAVSDTLDLGAGLRFAVGVKNTLALANAGAPEGALKLFNGYAGWGPGQLQAEIAARVWQVRPVSVELVFDPAPATQWERLTATRRAVRFDSLERPAQLGPIRPASTTGWAWP